MAEEIEIKREKVITFLKDKKDYIVYLLLALIIWFGVKIRLSNLPLLKDVTTGKFIPLALDPYVFLRYAKYIVENGNLFSVDTMRYAPLGLATIKANPILPYTIAYLYRFISIFNSSITIEQADILYPVIFFALGLVVFFLLVRRLFDNKVALLSTAFLAVVPTFLYRTIAGFSDKEALGIFLMFLSLYLYVVAWQSSNVRKSMLFGVLTGIATGLMTLAWGGSQFVFLLISIFVFAELLINKLSKKDFYVFALWLLFATFILVQFQFGWANFSGLIFHSFTTGIAYFVLLIGLIRFYVQKKLKFLRNLEAKLPPGVASVLLAMVFVIIISTIFFGPSFIPQRVGQFTDQLIHPFGTGRLTLTVAESHQPFFDPDWKNSFGWPFFWLFFFGSVLLFYNLIKPIKQYKWKLTILYVLFLSGFIFSRYSSSSRILNGESTTATILYLGSLAGFGLALISLYLYGFYKNKDIFEGFTQLDKKYIFIFIWFFLMIVAARGAIRLFFVFSSITSILTSYLVVAGIDYSLNLRDRAYKIVALAIIIFIIFAPLGFFDGVLVSYAKVSSSQAKFTGPSYGQQWQYAMEWVRENTPEDAVFAHWWDYGYWVQTGGQRATILDGGNFIVYWDYLMGRHVLTAQSEEEALGFLKTHGATHLLIDPTEIGKYTAYSSIGSDENFDRFSYIGVYSMDPLNIQETRDETVYIYQGGTTLDEDFIFEDTIYPRGSAGIVGFFIPVKRVGASVSISQPTALLVYQGQQKRIPLECLHFNGQDYNYANTGLKGCIVLIPTIDDGNVFNKNVDFPAAALYVSERARRALWVQLYLLDKQTDNFKEVYNDKASVPLALLRGRTIGPLKIWEINYPDDIQTNEEYLSIDYPVGIR